MSKQASKFEVPAFEQKNTCGTQGYKVSIDVPQPPESSDTLATTQQKTAIRQRAHQILFLPLFNSTDHIFYGDTIHSRNPREGYPSVRVGIIDGDNFAMQIHENLNWGDCMIVFYMGRLSLDFHIDENQLETDMSTADWLDNEVLTPVRDELMIMSKIRAHKDDFLG